MIRDAILDDDAAIAQLLGELGYPTTADAVRTRLGKLTVRVFVDDTEPLGVIAIELLHGLHDDRPVAMIMALVVGANARRRGIGKRLVDDAIAFAYAARLRVALRHLATRSRRRTRVLRIGRSRAQWHALHETLLTRGAAGLIFVITGAGALIAEQAFEKFLEPLLGTT